MANEADANPKAVEVQAIRDVRIQVDIPTSLVRHLRAPVNQDWWWAFAKEARSWARELQECLTKHGDWGWVSVSVVVDQSPACSLCDGDWEPMKSDEMGGVTRCANCGEPIEPDGA